MKKFSEKDRLVTFLKTYHPVVPHASSSLEQRIMAQVSRHPRPLRRLSLIQLVWLSAIAASLTATAFILQRRQVSPSWVTSSAQDLETFLVEGWRETMAESIEPTSSTLDWLLLGNPEIKAVNVTD